MVDEIFGLHRNKSLVELSQIMHPVGSIYLSVDSKDPGELFGGTWESIGQGRVLMGVGTGTDDNGETFTAQMGAGGGGEYVHKLTIDEMPSHTHSAVVNAAEYESTDGFMGSRTDSVYGGEFGTTNRINYTGGNQNHNNVQPYFGLYAWKRTG